MTTITGGSWKLTASCHLVVLQDVVLQVLQQLCPVVLVEQEVLLLLRQRRHDSIRGQEDRHRLVHPIMHQVHHTCVLKRSRVQYISPEQRTRADKCQETFLFRTCSSL